MTAWLPVPLLEQPFKQLSGRCAGQFRHEIDGPGAFDVGHLAAGIGDQLLLQFRSGVQPIQRSRSADFQAAAPKSRQPK